VSFENQAEWELVRNFMSGAGVKEIWTAGRLCDSEASDVVFIIVLSPWRGCSQKPAILDCVWRVVKGSC
jgi:hypothetical protein